ncbi:hypothetical protein EUGRSUZ_K00861 [Eucalyptus grandis]|uniref:Uncharacterized protein n=2 Tax=Eucalyptus grandis TaxID=71139 RepID=A0ACC3IRN9_EUCGR|nr:hypothetical protein EUGRSUZ_K00861 [Eucalyptus grandis]
MAETSKDELVQLIRRFGAYLTVKFSNIFSISLNNVNSRSLGAIAGFAVAVVFTWRLLRTPRGPQRRIQKRQAASPASSGLPPQTNTASTSSGVCSTSEDLRAQNVVDEFFQPVKPTLGQIVRQKLSEGRKVISVTFFVFSTLQILCHEVGYLLYGLSFMVLYRWLYHNCLFGSKAFSFLL